METFVVVVNANAGSILNANVGLFVGRSLNTFTQLSLIVANGDEGVWFDGVEVVDDEELFGFVGLISNIALSRKRVKALGVERRKAINNLVVKIIVRGWRWDCRKRRSQS